MQKVCGTSAKQLGVVKEMAAAGMQPTVMKYTTLVQQLMFEGNVEAA